MSTATITKKDSSSHARSRRAPASRTTLASSQGRADGASRERFDNIVIRIPGAQDARPLAELAKRAGTEAPLGGVLIAAQDERLLAAISTGTGESLVEPSASGAAAEAILRQRLAQLHRRRTRLRRPGTPS